MNRYYQLVRNEDVSELYIFGDIVDEAWSESDVSASSLCQEIKALDTNHIKVYINSYGGSVASGLGIYNQLKSHKAKVTTYCQGFGCSIASVIFMAGDERIMSNASLLMIHNAWCLAQGNAKDLRKQADDLDKITQASINAYMEHINISEEELVELLDNESWLTADECLAMGFATEVVREQVATASQSVKESLISMIIEMKNVVDDEQQEDEEQEDVDNQDEQVAQQEEDEENVEDEEEQEEVNDSEEDDQEEQQEEKNQGTELKIMSSFLNLFN